MRARWLVRRSVRGSSPTPTNKRLPGNIFWHPQKRTLVRVHPSLVEKAKGEIYEGFSGDSQVDYQGFILAAGAEVYLLAGLLGLGIGYLLASRNRCPSPGSHTKVYPYGGKPYSGPFGGLSDTGHIVVGNREFDPDHLRMAGPLKQLKDGKKFLDVSHGWVNPDELAKLVKAHNREGYRTRKGGRHAR